MGERKFCYKCMEKYDSALNVCPSCGYVETASHNPMFITPGTVLHDRYLVGILLEYNGEGATYVGHDISTGCRVLLREYMPVNLCTRIKNKATISVNYNNLAKYKAFMAEYTELNKSLARLRNDSNINPVLDMFAENNTTYTVFEYIEGVKMLDYLKENAGEISWEQVSKLFPPLFTTIGRLHNAGIIHRAISPDTVYITDKGELRLSGFCVSAVRTANAGLEYELFKGYAAPEQYSASSSSRQGSWTDVYSVCALIYRALTGCMPVDSVSRLKHDDLCEPYMLNMKIPQHVSRVIMEGMNLSGRDRIQTITELVTRLFEQPATLKNTAAGYTAVQENFRNDYNAPDRNNGGYQQQMQPQPIPYTADNYNPPPQNYGGYDNNYNNIPNNGYRNDYDDDDSYRYEKVNTVDRIKVPIIIGILLLAILLIIAVVIFKVISGDNNDDTSDSGIHTSTVTDNVVSGTVENTTESVTKALDTEVPDLVGKFYEPSKQRWQDFLTLDPTYEYNDNYDSDMIIEQDIEKGTMVAQGSVIKVKVSKGKESAIIPDYNGYTVSQYKSRLEEAGISDFNYQFLPSTSVYGTPNTITELQVDGKRVEAGTYFSNKEGKKLTVYYIPQDAVMQTTTTTVPVTTEDVQTTTAPQPTENIQTTTTVQSVEPPVTTQPPVVEPPVVTDPPVVDDPNQNPEYGQW